MIATNAKDFSTLVAIWAGKNKPETLKAEKTLSDAGVGEDWPVPPNPPPPTDDVLEIALNEMLAISCCIQSGVSDVVVAPVGGEVVSA